MAPRKKSRTFARAIPVPMEVLPEIDEFGPAMQALTAKQRAFVMVLLEKGDDNRGVAARVAGYGGEDSSDAQMRVEGHRLVHNPKVQAAIAEESYRRLNANAYTAIGVVVGIMQDEGARSQDRLKAAEIVLNRTGFHAKTETLVKVEDVTTEAQIQRVLNMAKTLGLDAKPMLESIGIDYTPFEEIP